MLFNCIKTIFDYSSRSRLQMKMSIQYAVLLVLFLVFRLGVNGAVAVGNRINDGLITEQGMSEQADIQLEKELEVNTTEKWEMAEADTDTEQRKKDTMAEIQKRQVELVEREQKVAQRENKVAEREAEVEQKENHIPDMKAVAEKWEVIQEILDGNFIHLSKKEIKRLRLEEKSMSDLNRRI
ncbi:bone marrow stromal antigen 2-like isoform X2 [Planococcus citri]|uniref:bone marrow stromal antigen 2-like isoform X2 n=1 Tax=Planococcus citri TaxID=170843 RepID=UPI0031F7BFE4